VATDWQHQNRKQPDRANGAQPRETLLTWAFIDLQLRHIVVRWLSECGFRSDSVTQWFGVILSAESPQDVRQRPSADHDHQRIRAGQPACANIGQLQSLSLTYKETKKA